jgi:hypothetical protein
MGEAQGLLKREDRVAREMREMAGLLKREKRGALEMEDAAGSGEGR